MSAVVRWTDEGERHWRAGDYAWMAAQVGPRRVLEIGCGAGFGTLALVKAGASVLSLEPEAACRELTAARLAASGSGSSLLATAVGQELPPETRQAIIDFAPEWVVCWLMGGSDEAVRASAPNAPRHQAVQAFREAAHRHATELAASLPSVTAIHLVDRTAFPWKIKDTARDTLVLYHTATTFKDTPFSLRKEDTMYRKLDGTAWPEMSGRSGGGIVPVLGSLIARRQN